MLGRLTLLFAVVTGLELAILVPVGGAIGILPTIGLILLTAVVGAKLASQQGSRVWNNIQEELRRGEMPADSLLDGLAVLIAGAFLLTPGVLTDVAGILLLIPPCRAPVKTYVRNKFDDWRDEGRISFVEQASFGMGPPPGADRPDSPFDDADRPKTPFEEAESGPRGAEAQPVFGPEPDAESDSEMETGTGSGTARRAEVIDIEPSDDEENGDDDSSPESLDPVGDVNQP